MVEKQKPINPEEQIQQPKPEKSNPRQNEQQALPVAVTRPESVSALVRRPLFGN